MPKKPVSFRLSDEAINLLAKLAEKDSRTQANMLELLIKEAAAKAKIKPDKK